MLYAYAYSPVRNGRAYPAPFNMQNDAEYARLIVSDRYMCVYVYIHLSAVYIYIYVWLSSCVLLLLFAYNEVPISGRFTTLYIITIRVDGSANVFNRQKGPREFISQIAI